MFVLLVSPSVNRGIRGGSRVSARPFSQFLIFFLTGITSLRGNNWRSKLLVMPSQFLTIAFGLAETCLGNAVTIWFLLPFLLECLNSFYIFPYLPSLTAFPVFNVLELAGYIY